MTTNHHTAVSAGAAATAATINAPLGQLDAKLTHNAGTEYASTSAVATTVTTNGTYYAVTGFEVSFTPAFTGQVFMIALAIGYAWSGTAGTSTYVLRITDSVNATVIDNFIRGSSTATALAGSPGVSGTRVWTAAVGDVGVVRKAKLYVTHTVNSSSVSVQYHSLSAITH